MNNADYSTLLAPVHEGMVKREGVVGKNRLAGSLPGTGIRLCRWRRFTQWTQCGFNPRVGCDGYSPIRAPAARPVERKRLFRQLFRQLAPSGKVTGRLLEAGAPRSLLEFSL
jgi:hypothetical protein